MKNNNRVSSMPYLFYCIFLNLLLLSNYPSTFAQELTPNYEVCPLNDVPYNAVNLNGGVGYQWDFCTGDLLRTPSAVLITDFIDDASTPGFDAWRPEGIELAYYNGNWYGFIINVTGKNLIRIDFGNSLNNPPTYINLGIIGNSSLYNQPVNLRIIKDIQGNWFLFANNNGFDTNPPQGNIVRIAFGNNLANPSPTASLINSSLFNNQAGGSQVLGFDIINTGQEYFLVGICFNRNPSNANLLTAFKLVFLNLGNNLGNNPISEFETIVSVAPTIPVARDIRFIKKDGVWHAFFAVRTSGEQLYRLDFGNNLSNAPTMTNISSNFTNVNIPFKELRLIQDGKNYLVFGLGGNGNVFRANLGKNIMNNTPTVQNLGNFGLLGDQQLSNRPSLTFTMAKENSEWYFFGINRHPNNIPPFNVNQLVRLKFPDLCNVLPSGTSTDENPVVQYLSQAVGSNYTNLNVLDAAGNVIGTFVDSVLVTPAVTGDFVLENQNECEDLLQPIIGRLGACNGEALRFFNTSFGLTSEVTQTWNFGDNTTSSETNPQHTYAQAGLYQVSLSTDNPNSACDNSIAKEVRLSPPPIADFRVKSIDCETGKVVFEDFSKVPAEDAALGGFLTRRTWFFGDDAVPTFEAGRGDLNRNNIIIRGNQSLGEGGQAQQLPAYIVANSYNVTLVVGNDVCCTSSTTRTISLDPNSIQADFNSSRACVGAPTQFTDLSTLATSITGEIEKWDWTFTAPSGNIITSFVQNPSITFTEEGIYEVRLKVSSQFTCSKEITQNIEVLPSSTSNFSASANIGLAPFTVQFTNLSSADAVTYEWDFGDGNTSQTVSPTHTFTNTGTYQVKLRALGSNGCGTLVQREIRVVENATSLSNDLLTGIRLYPNPNQGEFFVESTSLIANEVVLIVRDNKGSTIYRQTLSSLADRQKITLPNHLAAGMYFVEIQSSKESIVKKIIKQ